MNQLVPVHVFRAGPLQAVLWQRYDDLRRARALQGYKVTLHRTGDRLLAKSDSPTLIMPQELPQAIEALVAAKTFLSRDMNNSADRAGMFVSAIDLLGAKAQW